MRPTKMHVMDTHQGKRRTGDFERWQGIICFVVLCNSPWCWGKFRDFEGINPDFPSVNTPYILVSQTGLIGPPAPHRLLQNNTSATYVCSHVVEDETQIPS